MGSAEHSQIAAAWADGAGRISNAALVAESMAFTWERVDVALRPVIGQRGVDALYRRSLHLTVASHSWLMGACTGMDKATDLTSLKAALAEQTCADAVAAGGSLLHTFQQLLASLIGPSLTERLLRPVWQASDRSQQEPPA
jgi:hypothetical protein